MVAQEQKDLGGHWWFVSAPDPATIPELLSASGPLGVCLSSLLSLFRVTRPLLNCMEVGIVEVVPEH